MADDEQSGRDAGRDWAERTHAAVTALATTLKDVVTRQDKYERGISLNSFVAYVLFTTLLGGGFYFLYRDRAAHLGDGQARAEKARDEALAQVEAVKKDVAAREDGARRAVELMALVREGRRADLLARAGDLPGLRLSPVEKQVLEDAVARARAEMVDASFAAGNEAVRAQQWEKATTELERAVAFEPDSPRGAQASYQLGVAYTKLGNAAKAAAALDHALTAGAERGAPELRFQLASALEQSAQPDRARAEYTRFADTRPLHPWAQLARRKAAILAAKAKAPPQ